LAFSAAALADSVTGYIIDKNCSTKEAMRGNVECAQKCMKGGSPAVLVTEEGKVYSIADQKAVADHAGHKVTLTGKLSGDNFTSVDSVK
jgi:hypothetical protein